MNFSSYYAGSVPVLNTEEDVNEYLETIKVNFTNQRKLEKALRTRIKELEDEHYKDKRLQELTEELNKVRADARRGFSIEAKESEAIAAWKKEHDTEKHNNLNQYHGCSGGGYIYRFYPTAIGTFSECVCSSCHHKAFREAEGDNKKYNDLMKNWNASISFDDM